MADSSDRVAELKKKMQDAAARRAKEAEEAAAASAPAAPATPAAPMAPAPAPVAASAATIAPDVVTGVNPAAQTRATQASEIAAEAVVVESAAGETRTTTAVVDAAAVAPVAAATPVATAAPRAISAAPAVVAPSANGASAAQVAETDGLSAEELAKREMSRRELLTYAWGGALALVAGASGVGLFMFMYPRFRAGEFGGEFFVPVADVPAPDLAPVAEPDGKFWLVETESGDPKAIYMVCTHLGCLYKWEPSTFRFECPCHGSKFSKDGYYIEGPAPRSLDTFASRVEGDILIVDTGSKILGAPSSESPARAAAKA